jgi:murein DD-endopeptidase MepM/ murein hydrolase activator NlpD
MKLLLTILLIVMTLLSTLLGYEYYSLRTHIVRLTQLQDEYQQYMNSVRKMLRDYQRAQAAQEAEEEKASDEDEEKKKEQPFLVVNREPAYLKESTTRYLKERRMNTILKRIAASEEWRSPEELKKAPRVRARRLLRKKPLRIQGSLVMNQLAQQRALLKDEHKVHDISFIWPLDRNEFWISSFFGARRKPDRSWGFHYGIDMAAIKGTPIKAVADGIVVEAGYNKGYGNTVVIKHSHNYSTRYAHMHKIYVRMGQAVEQGERLGKVGDTGLVRKKGKYASHLHFEVYAGGKKVNPIYFF